MKSHYFECFDETLTYLRNDYPENNKLRKLRYTIESLRTSFLKKKNPIIIYVHFFFYFLFSSEILNERSPHEVVA